MPPKTRSLVFSHTKPYAAHPGGISPLTGGTNHWLLAIKKEKLLNKMLFQILLLLSKGNKIKLDNK